MDMRQITPTYFVSPQLDPADMAEAAAAGITTIICNRPDDEIPPSHHAATMADAAARVGLDFHALPLTHQTMTPDNVAMHARIIAEARGPVLAYCASGTRSTVAWTLGAAADMGVDAVLDAAASGGYDLSALRPTLEAAAAHAR
ncbi:MAG: TIGR01244 family sulfur transferase [Pseudomonadota bacterium]